MTSTVAQVREILLADDALTVEQREALADLFRVAYEQLVENDIDSEAAAGVNS